MRGEHSAKDGRTLQEPLNTHARDGSTMVAATALVRAAVQPTKQEMRALESLLSKYFRRPVKASVEIDPAVIGGLWIRVGDTVIDGSLRGPLEMLRHHLRAQSRIAVAAGHPSSNHGN